jgi:hypothetical protein
MSNTAADNIELAIDTPKVDMAAKTTMDHLYAFP